MDGMPSFRIDRASIIDHQSPSIVGRRPSIIIIVDQWSSNHHRHRSVDCRSSVVVDHWAPIADQILLHNHHHYRTIRRWLTISDPLPSTMSHLRSSMIIIYHRSSITVHRASYSPVDHRSSAVIDYRLSNVDHRRPSPTNDEHLSSWMDRPLVICQL